MVDGSNSSYARLRFKMLRNYGDDSFNSFVQNVLDSGDRCRYIAEKFLSRNCHITQGLFDVKQTFIGGHLFRAATFVV